MLSDDPRILRVLYQEGLVEVRGQGKDQVWRYTERYTVQDTIRFRKAIKMFNSMLSDSRPN